MKLASVGRVIANGFERRSCRLNVKDAIEKPETGEK
jgi:hypothetical protein